MSVTQKFRDLSIRSKVMLVAIIASLVAVFAVAGGLYVFQLRQFRTTYSQELKTLARVISENSAVAVAFNDSKTAKEILAPLSVKEEIANAAILTMDAKEFATYGGVDECPPPLPTAPASLVEHDGVWTIAEPIMLDGKRVGIFFMDVDSKQPLLHIKRMYASVTGSVLAIALAIVILLTYHLQKFITRPVQSLAAASENIAQDHDYSIRVAKEGRDEVGQLTDAFNKMLGRIQMQDTALQSAQAELRDQLDSLKREIGQRERAQAAQAQLTSIMNGTPDFVGSWEPGGRVLYLNPAARAMLGMTQNSDTSKLRLAELFPDWAGEYIATVGLPATIAEGSWAGETAILRQDGTELHVSQVLIAHKGLKGEIESFSTVMRDISERKEAERALRESQQKLLETSRLAGMAEVATGVLHNVGNVLNSVNVSGNLISEKLRNSKSEKLTKVANLIEEQGDNFANYVGTDPRGKLVPGLVTRIAAALRTEHAQLLSEVESITNHIGHIKQIVAMQQSFAKVGGVMEQLDIASIVDDALKIGALSLERHGIQVVRDFHYVPRAFVDKHKVLQILVNLLRNAKQAIEERGNGERIITVGINPAGDNNIEISIKDSGRGIEPENLVRIFSHGFTTKKTGHGFGLHSGANAAKEMGGSLRVASEGLGKGATFTLNLPVGKPDKNIRQMEVVK